MAPAGPITVGGPWNEFSFTSAGSLQRGPADPGGLGCIPSSSGNSYFVGAPPWTFVAPSDGLTLTVTEALERRWLRSVGHGYFNWQHVCGADQPGELRQRSGALPDRSGHEPRSVRRGARSPRQPARGALIWKSPKGMMLGDLQRTSLRPSGCRGRRWGPITVWLSTKLSANELRTFAFGR
jgi:hypothetical protein